MSKSDQSSLIRSIANIAIACLLAYGIFLLLGPLVLPVVVGVIISSLSRPLYNFFLRIFRLPALSALITVLLVLAIIVLPLALTASVVVREISNLNSLLSRPGYSLEQLNSFLNNSLAQFGYTTPINLNAYTGSVLEVISSHASVIIGSVFGIIISSFLAIVTAFYMLQIQQKFQETVKRYSPLSATDTMRIIQRARDVVRATVLGNLVMMIIQAIASGLGFWLFGISTPALLGILYGISSLVPSIGSAIVWVPVAGYQLLQGNVTAAIGVCCWAIAQVIVFDHYVGPILIERRAHLHPFLILLGVLGGVAKFGAVGVVLGPTMIALGIVGLEILHTAIQSPSSAEESVAKE